MTFEELKESAQSGNVDAMEQVGSLILRKADELIQNGEAEQGYKTYEVAASWFEAAAERESNFGCFGWAYTQDLLSTIDMIVGTFSETDWIPKLKQAINYCNQALGQNSDGDDRRDSLVNIRNNALMKLSLAYEHLPDPDSGFTTTKPDYESSIRCLKDAISNGCEGAKVLLGLTYFDVYCDVSNDENDLLNAFSLLSSTDILSDAVTFSFFERGICARTQAKALFALAIMYRTGVHGPTDLEKSFNLLNTIVSHDWGGEADGMVSLAREELAHYKTGLFGGLKYIE